MENSEHMSLCGAAAMLGVLFHNVHVLVQDTILSLLSKPKFGTVTGVLYDSQFEVWYVHFAK
jgi:hypothetical protein